MAIGKSLSAGSWKKVPVMGKICRTFILLFDNEFVGFLLGIVLYVVHISDLYSPAYGHCRSPYRG